MGKLGRAYNILKYKGLGFCAYRAGYAVRKRTGLLRGKFPTVKWDQISLTDLLSSGAKVRGETLLGGLRANGRRFFFNSGELPKPGPTVSEAADNILRNKFQYFFDKWYGLGDDVDWFLNPVTGQRADSHVHWSDVNTTDPRVGDIKFIWEPSRFA